tara:strand:- start:52 stop:456 length:405 start_codon:yes stop_codon:yes gene_type:complete
MAVKKLKAVSPDKLLNKGADMKPVTTGQMNNQVIPEINTDIAANTTASTKNSQKLEEVEETANTANGTASANGLKLALACMQFASCAEAAAGGVTVGQFFSLVKTFKIQNGEETQDCSIPVVVCMPASCEELCW